MTAFKNHTYSVYVPSDMEDHSNIFVQCACGYTDSTYPNTEEGHMIAEFRTVRLNAMPELSRMNAPKPEARGGI